MAESKSMELLSEYFSWVQSGQEDNLKYTLQLLIHELSSVWHSKLTMMSKDYDSVNTLTDKLESEPLSKDRQVPGEIVGWSENAQKIEQIRLSELTSLESVKDSSGKAKGLCYVMLKIHVSTVPHGEDNELLEQAGYLMSGDTMDEGLKLFQNYPEMDTARSNLIKGSPSQEPINYCEEVQGYLADLFIKAIATVRETEQQSRLRLLYAQFTLIEAQATKAIETRDKGRRLSEKAAEELSNVMSQRGPVEAEESEAAKNRKIMNEKVAAIQQQKEAMKSSSDQASKKVAMDGLKQAKKEAEEFLENNTLDEGDDWYSAIEEGVPIDLSTSKVDSLPGPAALEAARGNAKVNLGNTAPTQGASKVLPAAATPGSSDPPWLSDYLKEAIDDQLAAELANAKNLLDLVEITSKSNGIITFNKDSLKLWKAPDLVCLAHHLRSKLLNDAARNAEVFLQEQLTLAYVNDEHKKAVQDAIGLQIFAEPGAEVALNELTQWENAVKGLTGLMQGEVGGDATKAISTFCDGVQVGGDFPGYSNNVKDLTKNLLLSAARMTQIHKSINNEEITLLDYYPSSISAKNRVRDEKKAYSVDPNRFGHPSAIIQK